MRAEAMTAELTRSKGAASRPGPLPLSTVTARRLPPRTAIARPRRSTDESRRPKRRVREIEGLEADVEAARSEVFSAINSATALRHSLEHAATARDRVAETLSKLQVEADDVRIEAERAGADHAAAADGCAARRRSLEATRIARAARESELASARIEHEWRARSVRAREQELAGLEARLKSLEELEAARAEYGDAARAVLAQANGKVGQQGAVADYLEVKAGLRAGRRSLPRRSAAARHRRKRRTRRRRVSTACANSTPAAADS